MQNGVKLTEQATPESWKLRRIGWEVKGSATTGGEEALSKAITNDNRSVAAPALRKLETRKTMAVTEYVEVQLRGPIVPTDTGQRDA